MIHVSYLEVYNDSGYDLLTPYPKLLTLNPTQNQARVSYLEIYNDSGYGVLTPYSKLLTVNPKTGTRIIPRDLHRFRIRPAGPYPSTPNLKTQPNPTQNQAHVSYLEIYNDSGYDLLDPNS